MLNVNSNKLWNKNDHGLKNDKRDMTIKVTVQIKIKINL